MADTSGVVDLQLLNKLVEKEDEDESDDGLSLFFFDRASFSHWRWFFISLKFFFAKDALLGTVLSTVRECDEGRISLLMVL